MPTCLPGDNTCQLRRRLTVHRRPSHRHVSCWCRCYWAESPAWCQPAGADSHGNHAAHEPVDPLYIVNTLLQVNVKVWILAIVPVILVPLNFRYIL